MKTILYMILVTLLIGIVSASCQTTYEFILNNNWNYTDGDLIKENISKELINNFTNECGFSLPNKPLPVIVVYKNNTECDLDLNSFFGQDFPFFEIYLGDVSCKNAHRLNYIFTLEKTKSYSIKGIRIWFSIVFGFLIFLVIYTIKSKSINRLIHKNKDLNKQNSLYNQVK